MDLATWIDKFFILRGSRLKPNTQRIYREAARHMVAAWGEGREIGTLTRLDAAEFRAGLEQGPFRCRHPNGPADLHATGKRSENTVCKLIGGCRAIFSEAARLDLIPFNTFDREDITRPVLPKTWREVSRDDIERVIAVSPSHSWKCLWSLTRFGGLRVGEARRLRWTGVDFNTKAIQIVPEGRESTKQAQRVVPLSNRLGAILLAAFEYAEPGSYGPCDGLPAQLYQTGTKLVRAARLEPWSPLYQVLRRNCVTDWATAGFVDRDISAWAGHSSAIGFTRYHSSTAATWERVTGA